MLVELVRVICHTLDFLDHLLHLQICSACSNFSDDLLLDQGQLPKCHPALAAFSMSRCSLANGTCIRQEPITVISAAKPASERKGLQQTPELLDVPIASRRPNLDRPCSPGPGHDRCASARRMPTHERAHTHAKSHKHLPVTLLLAHA